MPNARRFAQSNTRRAAPLGQRRFYVITNYQFGDFNRHGLGAGAIAVSAGLRRSGACVDEEAVVPPLPGGLCEAGWRRLLAQMSRRVFAIVRASSPTGCSVGLPFKSKR